MKLSVVAALLGLTARTFPEPASGHSDVACAARLRIIYEAVQAYRRSHGGEVPRRLSELCPRYIHDPALLSCPQAVASGRFTPANRELWSNAGHEEFGSYNWEFSSVLVAPQWVGGRTGIDWHRLKTELTKSPIGDKVPLVRCQIEKGRMLNLSVTGEVYVSGDYWEALFVERFPQPYAQPFLILRDHRPIRERLPTRTPGLPRSVVDLAASINACFGDPWLGGRRFEALPLPPDSPTIIHSNGVTFELRGIVQTGGAGRATNAGEGFFGSAYPVSSKPIRVAARCSRIHLLHATAFSAAMGQKVGYYEIVTSSDGTQLVPLHMGAETEYWRADLGETKLPILWRGKVEGAGECALFHWTWQNPRPDEEIASICLHASQESVASPFLVAVMIEPAP